MKQRTYHAFINGVLKTIRATSPEEALEKIAAMEKGEKRET